MEPSEKSESYRFFEPNQVLSAGNLNQLFDYLDEQERLARANLIGTGIVCGLRIQFDPDESPKTVHLSKGCGITSEGYLIVEPDDVSLVSHREYTPPADPPYSFLEDKAISELCAAGEPGTTELTADYLEGKAVVLFLEMEKGELRNCGPSNCDDRGSEVRVKPRPLLVNVSDLTPRSLPVLPEVPLARLRFSKPQDLSGYENVYRDHFASVTNGKTPVARLADAIDKAYHVVGSLIPDLDNSGITHLAQIFQFPPGNVVRIQYYYDFLRDLTAAYHELRSALLQGAADCMPEGDMFPRHLVLGPLGADAAQYRNVFSPSHATALPDQKLRHLRFLFERINRMILDFEIPSSVPASIKITPSLFGTKDLSAKAMPFYYKPGLRESWDPSRQRDPAEVLSWWADSNSPDYVQEPLKFDLEPYDFFRVEGHIGNTLSSVRARLQSVLQDRPLPVLVTYLDADAPGDFLAKHPAVEHSAGVPTGGTFIVVHSGDAAICDFCLPYRLETVSGQGLGRVSVKECRYEWFDSRRHLSNIAQHPYYVSESKESEKQVLETNYVVLVYRYEIQGQSILHGSTPQRVQVPINELASGQLSAIARRMNEAFPDGLVFDYSRSANKLVIRCFANQEFRIEWGGLQGNQVRYAYTPDRIYRWTLGKWESLENIPGYRVTCQLRDEYRPKEYVLLHEDEYFAARYPVPPEMANLTEVIDWQDLIKARASQPVPIRPLLDAIKKVINETYNVGNYTVELTLVGAWANGGWVSRNAAENNFPSSSFVSLRQKVTGKAGPSDIDLLVYIVPGSNVTMQQVSQTIADSSEVKALLSGYQLHLWIGKKDAQNGSQL